MRRRAERVIRPTRAKTRRLRVLVITVRSPRPIRAVQPGAVGGEARRRHVVQPDAVLEVAYGVLDLGVAAMIGLQFSNSLRCVWLTPAYRVRAKTTTWVAIVSAVALAGL